MPAFSFLRAPNQPLPTRIGATVVASVFAIIGAGLIFGSFYGYSRQKKQVRMSSLRSRTRRGFGGRIGRRAGRGKNKTIIIGWWAGAVLLNMLTLPIALGAFSQMLETGDPKLLIPCGFGVPG